MSQRIDAVILAGGMARRMGGEDKGLVDLLGRPMIAHVIDRVKPQVNQILINANRNQTRYAEFGFPVIADLEQGYPGPLAGMISAGILLDHLSQGIYFFMLFVAGLDIALTISLVGSSRIFWIEKVDPQ